MGYSPYHTSDATHWSICITFFELTTMLVVCSKPILNWRTLYMYGESAEGSHMSKKLPQLLCTYT